MMKWKQPLNITMLYIDIYTSAMGNQAAVAGPGHRFLCFFIETNHSKMPVPA
jgi:hypothetical protein